MSQTVVGLYDHINQARATVHDLVDAGFARDQLSFTANAAAEEYDKYFDDEGTYIEHKEHHGMSRGQGTWAGAGIGGTIGGLGGLLMGLGLLAVPGVGPALAAGPIVSTLVGLGVGAAAGGITGALVNHGVPEEEAGYYAEGVRRGGSLVLLTVDNDRVSMVEHIMNMHHPVDIEERVAAWREDGFTAHDPKAEPYTPEQVAEEQALYVEPVVYESVTLLEFSDATEADHPTGTDNRYVADVKKYTDNVDADLVNAIVKSENYIGATQNRNAHLVACSKPEELEYIRDVFLISKLKRSEADADLDRAINEVCDMMGRSNRTKSRISFYYLLAKKLGAEAYFEPYRQGNAVA